VGTPETGVAANRPDRHQVQGGSAAGGQQGARARPSGEPVATAARSHGRGPAGQPETGSRYQGNGKAASTGPVPDTPSGGGTSPGTAAFSNWRVTRGRELASGGPVARWSDPMARGQQGQPEGGSRYRGNGRGADSPGPDWGRCPQFWRIVSRNSSARQLADSRKPGTAQATGIEQGAVPSTY
jgi:hypothetical protein